MSRPPLAALGDCVCAVADGELLCQLLTLYLPVWEPRQVESVTHVRSSCTATSIQAFYIFGYDRRPRPIQERG